MFKNITCQIIEIPLGSSSANVFKVASRKGDDCILLRIDSPETGLLHICSSLFGGSNPNKSAKHHTEMNWYIFSRWCDRKLFFDIPTTVMVLDKATYRTVFDEDYRYSISFWNKFRLSYSMKWWRGALDDWLITCTRLGTKQAKAFFSCPNFISVTWI